MREIKVLLKKISVSKTLYYSLRGIVIVSFFVFMFQGDWVNAVSSALIYALMVAPVFLKEEYQTRTPIELDIALSLFVFLTLFLGSMHDYYEKFWWFDGTLHFLSGILLGMVGFTLVYMLNASESKKLKLSPGFVALFAVAFSMAASVVWEIFEYVIADGLLGFNMQESGLPDTMGDFIVNATGAFIVAAIGYVWMRRRKRLPFVNRETIIQSDYEKIDV